MVEKEPGACGAADQRRADDGARMVQVRAAQADGRWENAYTASEMEVPADFIEALASQPEAKAFTKPSRSRPGM
ncbi:hypothetical protein [Aliamphritea spongicola]|nr:hypothetical protein [Aliamphritea spongicola]